MATIQYADGSVVSKRGRAGTLPPGAKLLSSPHKTSLYESVKRKITRSREAPVAPQPYVSAHTLEAPVETITAPKREPVRAYTLEQIRTIEKQTDLVFVGGFTDSVGVSVPVFMKARGANEFGEVGEENMAKLIRIRKGV